MEQKMESIKKKLEGHGYTCNGWAKAEDTSILDCVNPYGSSVRVLVDKPKYKDNKSRYVISEKDSVPESMLQKTLGIIDNLSGATLDCEHGMCLIYNGEVTHYTHRFPTLEKDLDKVRISPVLHISEIEADNKETLANTDLVTSRIHNESVEYSADIVDKLESSFAGLKSAYDTFDDGWHAMMTQLLLSTEKLRAAVIEEAHSNPNSKKHNELKASLNRKENFIASLVVHAKAVEPFITSIREMTQTLEQARENLEKDFAVIGE